MNPQEILDKVKTDKKILKSVYDVKLIDGHQHSFIGNKVCKRKFYLNDQNCRDSLEVETGVDARTWNLPHRRKFKFGMTDLIKPYDVVHEKHTYMVLEGQCLTIMGLVTYDGESGKLKMTDVVGQVAGGIKECYKYLDERLRELWSTSFILCTITGFFAVGLGAVFYSKHIQSRIALER